MLSHCKNCIHIIPSPSGDYCELAWEEFRQTCETLTDKNWEVNDKEFVPPKGCPCALEFLLKDSN